MKKLLLITSLVTLLHASTDAQQMVGVKGGLNINNLTNDNNGGVDEANSLNSFHAGITANLPFTGLFSVQPSLLVTGRGAEVSVGNAGGLLPTYFVSKTNPIYLQLPVTLNLNIRLEENSSFFIGAGGYAAAGIAGRAETHGKILGVNFSRSGNIDYSDDDPTTNQEEGAAYSKLKRWDYGATVTTGVILRGLMVSVFYDYGMAKVNSGTNNNQDDRYKNRTLGFSLGFLINTGKD